MGEKQRRPLNQCHLFRMPSPHALAKRTGWKLDKLIGLAQTQPYRVFPHRVTGRIIQEPIEGLQAFHRQIHRYLSKIEPPAYLHSATKGRSYLTNARHHVGGAALVKIDLKKFYQNVPQHRVMHFFRDVLECAPDVAGFLASLLCFKGHLPTGSSASPILSFYAFKPLFDSLASLAEQHGLKMTLYVDDLTFSGSGATRKFLHQVRRMIALAGLRSHKDEHFCGRQAKIVTGVVVGQSGISLPYSRWQKIRTRLRDLRASTAAVDKLRIYPEVVSRLYEATQIDPRCRTQAIFHHSEWRKLASVLPKSDAVTRATVRRAA